MKNNKRERYEDIELEVREIQNARKNFKKMWWVMLATFSLFNAIIFGGIYWVSTGESPFTAERLIWFFIVSASFAVSVIALLLGRIELRINRMEAHNVTVHDEVIRLQEVLVRFVVPEHAKDDAHNVVRAVYNIDR